MADRFASICQIIDLAARRTAQAAEHALRPDPEIEAARERARQARLEWVLADLIADIFAV